MVLIRRSLVMMGYLARLGTKNTYKAKFEALSAALDDAPSVDAEPVRHGKWIKGDYVCGKYEWKCSACGETEWRGSADWMKFCMYCGARMDGGEKK